MTCIFPASRAKNMQEPVSKPKFLGFAQKRKYLRQIIPCENLFLLSNHGFKFFQKSDTNWFLTEAEKNLTRFFVFSPISA